MRRPRFLLPVTVAAVTAITVTVTVGYESLRTAEQPSAGMALADALQPASRAVAVLEQQRQHLIVMTADAHSMKLVGSPSIASNAGPAGGGSATVDSAASGGSVSAPPPDPGTAQAIAFQMMPSFGFPTSSPYGCLDDLWNQESGWRYNAENASGAYGIPQALPGDKMASAGADWLTDAATQIRWGLGYIKDDYGTPCAAWGHEEADGWY